MNSTMHFFVNESPFVSHFINLFLISIAFPYCTFFHSLAGIQTMNMRMTLLMGKGLISKGLFTPVNLVMKRILIRVDDI